MKYRILDHKFAKKSFFLSIFLLIYLRHIDLKFILKKLYI